MCHCAPVLSIQRASLQEPGVSTPACGQAARPQCSLRESDGGSAPIANRSAESFHTYSGSTALGNFEIGSNDNASFPVYHRLSTVIFVSSKQYVEMFTIDPVDLQAALDKDVA